MDPGRVSAPWDTSRKTLETGFCQKALVMCISRGGQQSKGWPVYRVAEPQLRIDNLLIDVEGYLDKEELGVVRGTLVDLQGVEGTRRITELVEGVAKGLQRFVGYSVGSGEGITGLTGNGIGDQGPSTSSGSGNSNGQCEKCEKAGKKGDCKKYTSSYKREGDSGSTGDNKSWDQIYQKCSKSGTSGTLATLARILLGAIPLVFSGLSYMAWMAGSGKWEGNSTTEENYLLCQFMMRMGYTPSQLREVKGDKLYTEVIETSGILGTEKPSGKNYAQYLDELRKQAGSNTTTTTTGASGLTSGQHSLLKLNVLCSGYFRSLHTTDSIRDPRPRTPNTVREILYWLTSLPYCPIYRTLVPKVQEMIERVKGDKGQVTFYAKDVGGQDKQLDVSPDNVASYLLGAALVAPLVILCIQDTVECLVGKVPDGSRPEGNKTPKDSSPVAIHDLYANMQFYFSYPMSETQSYYLLQDNLVALFYQLYFLRLQCESGNSGDIWWSYCKYGEGVDCTDCKSWICKKGGQGGHGGAKDSDSSSNKCGTSTQSPLQAFLTDCLPGFTCDSLTSKEGKKKLDELRDKTKSGQQVDFKTYSECYPPFLEHRNHLPVGQECAVPMGFSGAFRKKSEGAAASGSKDGMIGLGINAVLAYYANMSISQASLYQITRCISSLTRRVPRSTGTLFGFFYYFAKMCDTSSSSGNNNGNGKEVSKALSEELLCCPGWREPDDLMKALKDWGKGSHKNGECSCLDSLHNCKEGSEKPSSGGNTCGYYLRALTGNLYNSLATQFTETYVSWIIHLTGLLEAGLRKLLEEFKMIKCSKDIGCKGPSGKGGCTCDTMCKGGPDGQHGEKCCCANVVDCVGVHGLFYRFGFTYNNPGWLVWNDAKRQCKDFHDQLGKVIGGNLFKELSNQLRKFMYSTRALFGVYIGVYWTAVIVYLLWSMTVNLDLVHIQSHWKPAQSHLVPLQRILADGSRNVKRVCTIGYFQDSGDRLLSQGISDVYL